MTPEASPFWQNAFLVGMLVVVGWCIWAGWRSGVVRAGVSLAGMVAGGLVAMAVGGTLGPLIGSVLPLPGILVGGIAGLVVGLGVYVFAWFLGALLFKRTAQQKTMALRLVYGGGGAIFGAFFGLTVIWGALLFVRGLGGFWEGVYESSATVSGRSLEANGATQALVKLKRSIEAGSTGRQLEAIDIMPAETYRIFDKLGRLAAQPAAVRRLLEYPAIRDVLDDPRIAAITADPEAADAAESWDYAGLMKNPALLKAANDPALIAKLQKIDLEKALDFALQASNRPGQ